jgi:hypothetical protein
VVTGGGSGGRGAREIGQQGRARAAADVQAALGRAAAGGGTAAACTAATARCSAPAAVSSRGAEGCQRKKKGGRGPRDSCAKPKNLGTSR